MGLEGRDYMRDDAGSRALAGSWATLPLSVKLIALNLVAFLLWQLTPLQPFLLQHAAISGEALTAGRVWTLLTAAFSHIGLWHLLWNMLFLYWFGPDLEQLYGRRNFLVLYLGGALVASLAHAAWGLGVGPDVPGIGASGAVMAIVVVTALLFPQRTILLMFVIPVPLWLLACIKLLGDVSGLASGGSGIAHAAHLGGAAAGLAFKLLDLRLFASPGQEEARAPLRRLIAGLRPSPRAPQPPRPRVDADTALQVDELLRKIHRDGIDSLSAEEREFLEGASARYRSG